jgi:hypothetical protein
MGNRPRRGKPCGVFWLAVNDDEGHQEQGGPDRGEEQVSPIAKAEEGVPLTSGTIVKWWAVVGGFVVTMTTVVVWASNVKASHDELRHEYDDNKAVVTKRLDQQDVRISDNTKVLTEFRSKLDTAITILQRIDNKVGNP